jgi:hypothetical protein
MTADKEAPVAVLLNGISRRDKAISGKTILPVIKAQNSLEVLKMDKGMQRRGLSPGFVAHRYKVRGYL